MDRINIDMDLSDSCDALESLYHASTCSSPDSLDTDPIESLLNKPNFQDPELWMEQSICGDINSNNLKCVGANCLR